MIRTMDYYNTNRINSCFYGDTEYLDRFMSDCETNQEAILRGKKRGFLFFSKNNDYYEPREEYVDSFLNANGLDEFNQIKKPFCVNDGSTNTTKNSNAWKLAGIFCVLFGAVPIIIFIISNCL